MESTKINILLFAGAVCLALASSNDCSTKMMECMGKVTEIQMMVSGVGQGGGIPSEEIMISTMCKSRSLDDVDACFEAAAKICGDSAMAMMDQVLGLLAFVKSKCEPDNPCSQLKLLECSRSFLGVGQGGDMNYNEMCPTIPESMNCLQTGKDACKDPEIKAQFDQGLTMVRHLDISCKQQLENNNAFEYQNEEPQKQDIACSELKLLECSRSLPEVVQGEDMNFQEICPTITESMNCLQTGRDACKDELMKAHFDERLTMIRNMDNSCKQQLEDNYAFDAQKQDGDGTSKGGSGSGDETRIGRGSGNFGSNGSGKLVGMTGLLIFTSLFAKLAQ